MANWTEIQKVTEGQFFAVVNGPADIHPRCVEASLKGRWHISIWENQLTREVVGKSETDSWGIEPYKYYLATRAEQVSA